MYCYESTCEPNYTIEYKNLNSSVFFKKRNEIKSKYYIEISLKYKDYKFPKRSRVKYINPKNRRTTKIRI